MSDPKNAVSSSNFSKIYNDYIFSDLMIPSNISVTVEVLKNDQLELQLFQVMHERFVAPPNCAHAHVSCRRTTELRFLDPSHGE